MKRCACISIVAFCVLSHWLSAMAQETMTTEEEFFELIRSQGIARATEVFENLRREDPDAVIFSESAMNRLGYRYLGEDRVEEAIEIFKLNVMAYPDASNTYDSLGEAYMIHGEIEPAIANYKKSVELNPENENGARYVHTLEHYVKYEYRIPMRDGVRLFTQVYVPRDRSRDYPILLKRTPYGLNRYGPHNYNNYLGPSLSVARDGYVFVYQDVRGRYMSEGLYDNMRPHVPGDSAIDESSDTYDTIEWLLENIEGHNGKVGMWGTSYPGFYVTAALPEGPPRPGGLSTAGAHLRLLLRRLPPPWSVHPHLLSLHADHRVPEGQPDDTRLVPADPRVHTGRLQVLHGLGTVEQREPILR